MDTKDLSPELLERVKAAQTPEDIIALAKEEGYELSDEELDDIAGGASWEDFVDGMMSGSAKV